MLSEGEGFKGREKKEASKKKTQNGTQQSCRINEYFFSVWLARVWASTEY